VTADYNDMVDQVSERLNNQATLSFRFIEGTAREIFGGRADLSLFAGYYDNLGSGDDFPEFFGTGPVSSSYRGFFYFPEGIGGDPSRRYNGAIHSILGTGLNLSFNRLANVVTSFYAYQDISYHQDETYKDENQGFFTGDFRLLANSEAVKFEFFAGGSYLREHWAVFHSGFFAYFHSPAGLDLVLQAGIPYWRWKEDLSIDNCYFLMEPRLYGDHGGLTITFFYHPMYYQNVMTSGEQGMADINLKLFLGRLERSSFEAGLEGTISLKNGGGDDFKTWVSPFVSVLTSGLRWDVKVRFNPLYFNEGGSLAEGFIGIRTVY